MKKILTLCIIHQHPKVLLGMKKRGFGEGRWNGFGGKVMEGETIEEAARRELHEEIGIKCPNLEKLGTLDFMWDGKDEILEVNIFRGDEFFGEPRESGEMRPEWFYIDEIPFHSMWQDERYWFPLFLKGRKFRGKFIFDESDNIIDYELREI
jgi:8-oxo-dGTP diphosphatase/2-hydroxy-dATP diphosphatase